MDVNFELGDYKFVWDSDKAEKILENTVFILKTQCAFFLMKIILMILMNCIAILKTDLKLLVKSEKFLS